MIKHGQDGSVHCLRREDECEEKENSERQSDEKVMLLIDSFLKGI